MSTFKRSQIWWALANMLGIVAFLAFASKYWIEPELANEPGASAGNFIFWGISALPLLVIFFLLHLIVGGMALQRKQRDWALLLLATTACWILAAMFDNARHGI